MPTYRIIPERSPVTIDAESSMHPVHASSSAVTGTLELRLDGQGRPDLDAPYAARLSVPVESITSGHGLQDREMHRRLDTRRHPRIGVEVTDAARLADDGRYRAKARITVRGETRDVEGEVALSVDGDQLVVEGQQTIDMRIFGVDPPRLLVIKVQPEVVVRVRLVAQREASGDKEAE